MWSESFCPLQRGLQSTCRGPWTTSWRESLPPSCASCGWTTLGHGEPGSYWTRLGYQAQTPHSWSAPRSRSSRRALGQGPTRVATGRKSRTCSVAPLWCTAAFSATASMVSRCLEEGLQSPAASRRRTVGATEVLPAASIQGAACCDRSPRRSVASWTEVFAVSFSCWRLCLTSCRKPQECRRRRRPGAISDCLCPPRPAFRAFGPFGSASSCFRRFASRSPMARRHTYSLRGRAE
mmetsp:Transcript_67073/g.120773  ORF Transcript_67073/g.120773 Transcript_67073/m.120773 type:complete len:236 (+) Transcript_67073:121-828(+)